MRRLLNKRHPMLRVLTGIMLMLLPFMLVPSSAATLGGITSGTLWAASAQQPHYEKATIQWGLDWGITESMWSAQTADVSFYTSPDSTEPVSLKANHTVGLALHFSDSSSCTVTSRTAASTSTTVALQLDSGTCAGKNRSTDMIVAASIAVDGSVIVGRDTAADDSSASNSASFAAPISVTSAQAMNVSTESSSATTLTINNTPNPANGTVTLYSTPIAGNSAADGSSTRHGITLSPSDYQFIAGSDNLGTLTITVPRNVTISNAEGIQVAIAPLQTITDSSSPYHFDRYEVSASLQERSCRIMPDDLPAYDAILRQGQTVLLPMTINGVTTSGQQVDTQLSYQCGFIHYDASNIINWHYSLTNSSGSDLSRITMTFDMSKEPVSALGTQNLQVTNNNSYGETVGYDSVSHILTVTYDRPLSANETVSNLQIYLYNVPVERDIYAATTVCVVQNGSNKADVRVTATSTSEFPKAWSNSIDLNPWIINTAASDVLDPLWNVSVTHDDSQPGIYGINATPSSGSMKGMVVHNNPSQITLTYHKSDWSNFSVNPSRRCE